MSRTLSLSTWYQNITSTLSSISLENSTESLQDAAENLAGNLQPASDVDIEGVRAAIYFNALVFCVLAVLYECLRTFFPNVYASRQTRDRHKRGEELDDGATGSCFNDTTTEDTTTSSIPTDPLFTSD